MPQNRFASDNDPLDRLSAADKQVLLDKLLKEASTQSQVFDISKPPVHPYNPHDPKNEFPKMLYAQDKSTVVVGSKQEENQYLKKGYSLKPILEPAAVEE